MKIAREVDRGLVVCVAATLMLIAGGGVMVAYGQNIAGLILMLSAIYCAAQIGATIGTCGWRR